LRAGDHENGNRIENLNNAIETAGKKKPKKQRGGFLKGWEEKTKTDEVESARWAAWGRRG